MKKLIIIFFTAIIPAFFFNTTAYSQDNYNMCIGTYISAKMGINGVNPPNGRQNGINFNSLPDFGMEYYVPLSMTSQLGLLFDLGYSTYSYKIKAYPYLLNTFITWDSVFTHQYSYVTLGTNLFFDGMTLGFNIGFPSSAKLMTATIKTSDLSTILELTIGGRINLFGDETGRFTLYINGGYMISGIYKDFAKSDPINNLFKPPQTLTNIFNPRAASLSLGLNYMFNLVKPPKEDTGNTGVKE